MSLLLWICLITIIFLFLYMFQLYQMSKKKKLNAKLLAGLLIGETVLCLLLCLTTSLRGTRITESQLVTSLTIAEGTLQEVYSRHHGFQLTTTDGMSFDIADEEFLTLDFPSEPKTLEIYRCRTCDGFSWCYLNKTTSINYALK